MQCSKALVGLLLVAAGLSACVRAQAKTPVVVPQLSVPEPPERVIVEAPAPDIPEPPPAPPAPASPPVVPPRAGGRGSPPAPAPAALPTPAPEPPPVLLQTSPDPAKDEKQINDQITIAKRDVDRANSRPLTRNGQAQLDATRGLLRQAEEALKAHNLRLARELADKAAALASQLAR